MPPMKRKLTPHGGQKKGQWTKRVKKCSDPLIEESDTSFTSEVLFPQSLADSIAPIEVMEPTIPHNKPPFHMLPEDHPSHSHMNKLSRDFKNLTNAFEAMKSKPAIEKGRVASLQRLMDVCDDTLCEIETIESSD